MINTNVDFEAGMAYHGNTERLAKVLKKAELGQTVTLGFLGGSITQGSLSSTPDTCYAALVTKWWREQYPQAEIRYINAGIGGTTSQFGVVRVDSDVLAYEPDVVFVEFSVNDSNDLFFRETFEGLIRRIYYSKTAPAVMIIHNVMYFEGTNAQDQHELIGRYYKIPCVSMKTSVYPAVAFRSGGIREITPDDLHPNDAGHELLARLVTYFLEKVQKEAVEITDIARNQEEGVLLPITENTYEKAKRYQNYNCSPRMNGFVADTEPQNGITDVFKRGFIGTKKGDSICFEVEGRGVAIQYRKSVKHPACVAEFILDGQEDLAQTLDGNFEETWGDCLYISTVVNFMPEGKHTVEIRITEGDETMVPFYLVSVIAATNKERENYE